MGRTTLRKKIVIVGDGTCGKTSLLIVYQNGKFPERYLPTVFENYISRVELDNNKSVELALWDTAGQEDYDRLRPLSYFETDVVMICYAVDNMNSFQNVRDKWLPEIKHYCGNNVSLVLVGLKIDLRSDSRMTGLKLAKEIGAKYGECSAKMNTNVKDVIRLAAQVAVKPRRLFKRRRRCNIL
ncbi:small GTPase superfamily [Gilbertella persicaria]|uniref:small GTPase superfamily n=1 Tax=Gilbertella persicaria TaxID=101096 RepID=UPI00221F7AEB|nr:small GTPase superfamily [Gilbertella persicaria]KAI8085757.1 small GTPase superfamily [Gilbertella persicaria]